jgi:hypothetical protein
MDLSTSGVSVFILPSCHYIAKANVDFQSPKIHPSMLDFLISIFKN